LQQQISNLLFWSGVDLLWDFVSDYPEVLLPFFWGWLAYIFHQEAMTAELERERDSARKYVEVVGVILVILDKNERVTFINRRGMDFVGYSQEDILGKNIFEAFIPEDERPRLHQAFSQQMNRKVVGVLRGESRVYTHYKGIRLVSWTSTALINDEGEPIGLLCSAEDITDDRKLEELLITTRAQERALIDTLPHLAWVKDMQGRYILVNRAFAKACGFDIRSIVGKTDLEIWPREVARRYQAAEEELLRTGKKQFSEEPIEGKNGRKWMEVFRNPIFDLQGSIIGTTGIARDITERKLAEQALRESEAKLKSAFLASPFGIAIAVDRVIRDVNDRFCDMIGYSRQEILGQNTRMIYESDKEYESVGTEFYKDLSESGIGIKETRWRHKDGRVLDVVLRASVLDSLDLSKGIVVAAIDITERKRAERQLRDSEEKFSRAFHTSPTPMAISSVREGVFVDVNEAFLNTMGYRREEIVGNSAAQISIWRDLKQRSAIVAQLEKNGRIENAEVEMQDKNGRLIYGLFSADIIKLQERSCMLSVLVDITGRREAEQALRDSEQKLRQIIDLVPHFIFAKNRLGQFVMVNKSLADVYGTTVEELLGKTDADFSRNMEEVYHFIADDNEVMDSGHPKDIPEEKITDSAGRLRYLHTTKIPFHIASSGEDAVLGVSTDITERKQAIEALRESEEKYRTLIEASGDVILVADSQTGEIIDGNKKAEDLFGLPLDKIIGMNFIELHPKGEASRYRDFFFNSIKKKGDKGSLVGFVQHKEKGRIPVHISVLGFEIKGRKVNIGVFRDISELKVIEEALLRDKSGLEKVVNEKTEILRKTLRELEDAKRLSDIGALAATVAHELRNPLGVIKTAAYNIRQKNQGLDIEKHLANIDKKIMESERIIKNLLSYAQIKTPAYEKVNVLDVLNECIENCRHKYRDVDAQITLKQRGGKILPIADMDPLHLNELLSNILDNAFQALVDRHGQIGVDFDFNEKKGAFCIDIKDNGIGIEKELLPNVFDPFFTTKSRGTGLGLSVCNQIVNLYGGDINIQSVKGEGTTVTLNLPINRKG